MTSGNKYKHKNGIFFANININMKQLLIVFLLFASSHSIAQVADTLAANKIIVHQDYRMDILARKESEINTAILKDAGKNCQWISAYDLEY